MLAERARLRGGALSSKPQPRAMADPERCGGAISSTSHAGRRAGGAGALGRARHAHARDVLDEQLRALGDLFGQQREVALEVVLSEPSMTTTRSTGF